MEVGAEVNGSLIHQSTAAPKSKERSEGDKQSKRIEMSLRPLQQMMKST